MAGRIKYKIILVIFISYVDSSEDVTENLDSFQETLQKLQNILQESLKDDRHDNLNLDLKGLVNIEHVNFHVKPEQHYNDYTRSIDPYVEDLENICKKIGRCGCGGGGRCGNNPEEPLDSQDIEHLCKKIGRCGCGGGGRCGNNPEKPLDSQDIEHLCKKIGRCGCGGGGRCGDNPEADSQESLDRQDSQCKFGRCGCGGGRCGNNPEAEELDAAICKLTGLRCNQESQRTDDLEALELVPYKKQDNVKSMNIYFDDNDLRDDDNKSTRFLKEVYTSIREKLKKYVLEKLKNKLKAYLGRGSNAGKGFLPSQVSDEEVDGDKRLVYLDALRRVPVAQVPVPTKKNPFPLTKQQKEKFFGHANQVSMIKKWRRNIGDQPGQRYGIPFELEVQGLGQVNT